MIRFTTAKTESDLTEILTLQKENLPQNLSSDEARSQGFVTVSHSFELIAEMNAKNPHIIAKSNDKVIGYALVMLEHFKNKIPILIPMFDQINNLNYEGKKMSNVPYFIMGQVCIAKPFRGKGIFKGLYEKMKIEMSNKFDLVITEVATRNIRSMKAHEKIGFKTIKEYATEDGEQWAIIAWGWQ